MQATAEATIVPAADGLAAAVSTTTARKRARREDFTVRPITVVEYHRMAQAGILAPREPVELLDGQLIAMPPIGPPHAYTVHAVARFFFERFSERAYVSVQGPVTLDERSELQPDLMLSALPAEQYAVAHPTPAEVLLVVEVASSSLGYDSGMKLRAYARRSVREYWIVDLEHDHVDVYREPDAERYKKHRRAGRGKFIAPLAFPDDAVAVSDILPPPR
jgi:Uma2 family endonuclease